MNCKQLGTHFDIHGGGSDLMFPHHENEVAQSTCAHDGDYVNYWMHSGMVMVDREKMSKSLGNVLSVPKILEAVRPVELRYYLGSAHYRSMLEYSPEALQEAATGYRRIESFVSRVLDSVHDGDVENFSVGTPTPAFVEALDEARLYFADEDAANAEDPVLNMIDPPERRRTLLARRDTARPGGPAAYVLDIRLQGPDETVFLDV